MKIPRNKARIFRIDKIEGGEMVGLEWTGNHTISDFDISWLGRAKQVGGDGHGGWVKLIHECPLRVGASLPLAT